MGHDVNYHAYAEVKRQRDAALRREARLRDALSYLAQISERREPRERAKDALAYTGEEPDE